MTLNVLRRKWLLMGKRFNPAIADDASMNRLLGALPKADLHRWLPELELVNLDLGQVLHEVGDTPTDAYFPINTVVSLLYVMDSGESAEIAIVGNEGMVGVSLFMGGGAASSRAVVQNAGQGFRLSVHALDVWICLKVRRCFRDFVASIPSQVASFSA
ncbi:hypothetical protein [Polaromonas sp.]|uniref:hypothetical protein n=1 Tax=Polaromonas sp. TaxID=1869339 RepID=UPI003CA4CE39